MKLFALITGCICFMQYVPACERCQQDINNLISHLESVQYLLLDGESKAFYDGEMQGLKISRNIYRINHEDY